MKTKLVYVLPVYDPESSEHTFHIHGFLEEAAQHLDVLLFIERARSQPSSLRARVYLRRTQLPVLSSLETLVVMVWARLHGYERFYTHYSMSAAILSALTTRLLGGESFYWNCGHMKDFAPKRVRSFDDLRNKLRNDTLLALTLRLVHHLVTGPATMARYYSESYGIALQSIRLMPNWVDLRRFAALPGKNAVRVQLGLPVGSKVVLFLHRLAERKGAHHIVPIAREVLTQYQGDPLELLFVVAGDGPYGSTLAMEIRDSGLQERFRLVGRVPNQEAIKYFVAADVYMMPSEEEGFPRTLLEAMAAGCPFTAGDVGGVSDIVTSSQARFVVPAGDWRAMAAAVSRLLDDSLLWHELAKEGKAQVANYDQGKVVQLFVSLVSA